MKRKFIVFLCAALLISCMAVPVGATSLQDNPNLVTDLLEFGYSLETNSNFRNFQGQGSMTYNLPSAGLVTYIDVVFDFWGGSLDQVQVLRNGTVYDVLPVHHVAGDTYRVYGSISSAAFVSIGLNFLTQSTSYCYVTIKSFNVGHFRSTVHLTEAYCQITSYNYEKTIHYVPTDESNKRSWVNDYTDGSINYSLNLWAEDWENYDFIDFFLFTVVGSVDSISCTMSGHAVPFSVSYINSGDDSESYYTYVIRLDLRELDRSKGISGDYPLVIVDGQQVVYGMTNLISVLSVTGFTEFQDTNPITYWLLRIYNSLSAGFTSLRTAIADQTTAITNGFNSLQDSFTSIDNSGAIASGFASLKTWIETQTAAIGANFTSLSGWISNQTQNLHVYFTQLQTETVTQFTNLSGWISNQTSSLTTTINDRFTSLATWISNQTTAITSHMTDRFTALSGWISNQTQNLHVYFTRLQDETVTQFTNLSGWISNQTQNLHVYFTRLQTELVTQADQIEAAIRGDPAPGNSFQDKVDQKENELDQMAAVMDSVSKPDISTINVSVDRYVSASDMNTLTAPLAVFFSGNIFAPMIIMSILMATVSFVLYGKKG